MAILFKTVIWLCAVIIAFPSIASENDTKVPFVVNYVENDVIQLTKVAFKPLTNNKSTLEGLQNRFKSTLLEEEKIDQVNGVYLENSAKQLSSLFRIIGNEELGVTSMQEIYDSLPHEMVKFDPSERLKEVSKKLQNKLLLYSRIVNRSRLIIEDLFRLHLQDPLSQTNPCCDIQDSALRYDEHFGTKISLENSCDVSLPSRQLFAFSPGRNLTHVYASNLRMTPGLKWQYFIGSDGAHCEYPSFGCRNSETDYRADIYVSTVYPQRKVVVILVDHGSAMSYNQLMIAKALGKYFVNSLSDRDSVGVVAISSEIRLATVEACPNGGFANATADTKFSFTRFLDYLEKGEGPANHTLAMITAFNMIKKLIYGNDGVSCAHSTNDSSSLDVEPIILYISRGLLMSLTERGSVLNLVARENQCLRGRVIINTYPVIDDGKPIMYEKSFLYDLAQQDRGRMFQSEVQPEYEIRRGQMIAINSTLNLSSTLGNFYRIQNGTLPFQHVTMSSSFIDPVGKGIVISLSMPCYHVDHLIGVTGVDIALEDFLESVIYSQGDDSYVFVINSAGFVIYHPLLGRPGSILEQPMHVDLKFFEYDIDFGEVRERILREPSGYATLLTTKSDCGAGCESSKLYTWQHLHDSPLIICVVTTSDKERSKVDGLRMVPTYHVVYHRLDLNAGLSSVKMCMQAKQTVTFDAASLFLSPSCFVSPYKFLRWGEASALTVQSYLGYLSDNTNLIANPGLRSRIRSGVGAVIQIAPKWKEKMLHSHMSHFIIRRYMSTSTGVYLEYPGTISQQSMDPTRRTWYIRALEFPGRVVLTGPWLDPGGVGYVFSLSHTLYEGKPAALHGPNDPVIGVLGADFRLNYLYRLLQEVVPFCPPLSDLVNEIRCFIIDDRGYVLAHPKLFASARVRGVVELQHLTHLEPLIASDLLEHEDFVVKKACYNFLDRTIQRYYQINMSLSTTLEDRVSEASQKLRVLTNLVHGEHCSKYQISPIPGTNILVGFVNQTCDTVTAFCPCSTVDRLCLNCHRMEQSECECPCECPLELDLCRGETLDKGNKDVCQPESETSRDPLPSVTELGFNYLDSCRHLDCEYYETEGECMGVVGCEWCYLQSDGETFLNQPICSLQHKCFGGVKGGFSPYLPSSQELLLEIMPQTRQTQIGPVVGGIVAMIIIISMGIYCYKQHLAQESSVYLTHLTEGNVRMSEVEEEEDNFGAANGSKEGVAVQQDIRLIELDNIAAMSPYRVNTRYRRPPASESDHGYSTMTPHEDSEHTISFQEPLLTSRDRYRPAVSVSSRASSPLGMPVRHPKAVAADLRNVTSPTSTIPDEDVSSSDVTIEEPSNCVEGMTVLPSNVISVPVTVHQVDTS
ncbi:VWFA and cache domain-containing protein 1-like [Artemia franciscana]|uniref:VWFA and cache domain-containing protein 1-like n=1 Tax=Artemia franciscana TaxID=6661 RepID=UPI0032DB6DC7